MKLRLPYLGRELELEIPDTMLLSVVEPNEAEDSGRSPAELVADAVGKPMDSPPLADFLAPAERLLVIVNDATRPTPTPAILDAIGDALEARDARFIVATGAHRGPTEDEYRQILGAHYE